jgi:hypothetical protein
MQKLPKIIRHVCFNGDILSFSGAVQIADFDASEGVSRNWNGGRWGIFNLLGSHQQVIHYHWDSVQVASKQTICLPFGTPLTE